MFDELILQHLIFLSAFLYIFRMAISCSCTLNLIVAVMLPCILLICVYVMV